MMLNYTTNKNIVIEARESCRVPVPVERCPLFRNETNTVEDKDNLCTLPLLFTFLFKKKKAQTGFHCFVYILDFHVQKTEAEITQQACSKHISDSVQLNWSLLNTNIKGTASLRGITLSSSMLSIITVAPLKWGKFKSFVNSLSIQKSLFNVITFKFIDIEINKKVLPSQSELSCATGQSIPIRIDISNQSPAELTDLVLSIQFYQDYQNGTTKYQLETRVAMSGPNQ